MSSIIHIVVISTNNKGGFKMKDNPGKLISSVHRKSLIFWSHALREYDISSSEYPILIILNEKEGFAQDEIARKLNLDKSGITRTMKSLLDKGFIERKKDRDDLRCNRIYLTEKGKQSWEPIQNAIQTWNEITEKGLSKEEIELFLRVLSKMECNMVEYLKKQ